MAKLIAYPETIQFRQIITHVNRHMGVGGESGGKQLPILKFIGTVKLHGANTAIVYQRDIGHWCQSRNHVITSDKDHADFAQHIEPLADNFFTEYVLSHCPIIREYYERGNTIIIYGEWCGADIQGLANVAIAGLTKMFVIFKIKIINRMRLQVKTEASAENNYNENLDGFWLDPQEWTNIKWHEHFIYNIYDFPTYEIDIDFNAPEQSQNILTQITEKVEQQCPVGTYFKQIGCGEGVVWTEWKQTQGCLLFKVKGQKYSVINSETLVPTHTPNITNVHDFIEYACTKNRMQQAFNCLEEELSTIEMKDFSIFVRWLTEDIVKEEKDTMVAARIDAKEITRAITNKVQTWFSDRLVENRKAKTRQKKTYK